MATSSIFSNVRISDPKQAELFIDALESSQNAQSKTKTETSVPVMRDIEEIKKLMSKRLADK